MTPWIAISQVAEERAEKEEKVTMLGHLWPGDVPEDWLRRSALTIAIRE